MPTLVPQPSTIPVPGGKIIDEFAGLASTGDAAVSIARMTAPGGWSEPFQRPDFDEFTLVLSGEVHLDHDEGTLVVPAGQCVVTRAGERIRYSCGPAGAEYVAVCLPAFSPSTVHREDEQ